jgi:hypothetical protein
VNHNDFSRIVAMSVDDRVVDGFGNANGQIADGTLGETDLACDALGPFVHDAQLVGRRANRQHMF